MSGFCSGLSTSLPPPFLPTGFGVFWPPGSCVAVGWLLYTNLWGRMTISTLHILCGLHFCVRTYGPPPPPSAAPYINWRLRNRWPSFAYFDCLSEFSCQGFGLSSTLGYVFQRVNCLKWTQYVTTDQVMVLDSTRKEIQSQIVPVLNASLALRKLYATAYLGKSPGFSPLYWLAFTAVVPPSGFNTYIIASGKGKACALVTKTVYASQGSESDVVEVGPGNLKLAFSGKEGKLAEYPNARSKETSKFDVCLPTASLVLWLGHRDRLHRRKLRSIRR